MQAEPKIEVDKKTKTVTISTMATFVGKLEDGESVNFDIHLSFDIDELARIIGKDAGPPVRAIQSSKSIHDAAPCSLHKGEEARRCDRQRAFG
jgi:hypothetical protein